MTLKYARERVCLNLIPFSNTLNSSGKGISAIFVFLLPVSRWFVILLTSVVNVFLPVLSALNVCFGFCPYCAVSSMKANTCASVPSMNNLPRSRTKTQKNIPTHISCTTFVSLHDLCRAGKQDGTWSECWAACSVVQNS